MATCLFRKQESAVEVRGEAPISPVGIDGDVIGLYPVEVRSTRARGSIRHLMRCWRRAALVWLMAEFDSQQVLQLFVQRMLSGCAPS
jgi:hypothetical protein